MNSKRILSLFCMFLIVMLPICMADEFEEAGESLIIEAKKYEPEVLRSDYMEQLNIPVRVILGAIRGAPISVPEIKDVDVEIVKKAEAQKENASVQGTSKDVIDTYIKGTPKFYHAPYPTLDNLGYVQITLKKIEEEHKVPEQIDIDFKATIKYEADLPAFTIGGEQTKVLKQAALETVKDEREKHSILDGNYYLRVSSIKSDSATIEILDHNFEKKTSVSLDEGEISRSVKISEETEPESIRLKLEEIRGPGVVSLRFKDGNIRKFDEGKEVAGDWVLDKYLIGDKRKESDDYVVLKNKGFKSKVILTKESSYDTIAELKESITNCPTTTCKIYKDSSIKAIINYVVGKDDFLRAVGSLEILGLELLKGVEPTKAGMFAELEIGGVDYTKSVGDEIGDCGCEIQSISKEAVWIKDIKKCDQYARSNTEKLEVGDSEGICGTVLELKGITSDLEAFITLLPGTGKGKTTTYFSIHIPVEKRVIEYTPEELQQKIKRTQATIEKLDKTIKDLETLVEGWTKVCLATMAVFTVTAFLQGVSGKEEEKAAEKKKAEETKEIPVATLKFPQDVKELTIRDLRENKDRKLESGKKYTVEGGLLYDENHDVIGTADFRFSDKKGNYYLIGENGELVPLKGEDKYYGSFTSGDASGSKDISVSSDLNTLVVPLQKCGQLTNIEHIRICDTYRQNLGTALYLVYYEQEDYIQGWWGGKDGKLYILKNGENDGDKPISGLWIDGRSAEGKRLKTDMLEIRNHHQRGEKNYKWQGSNYNLGRSHMSAKKEGIECGKVMSPGQCKILFNACDPVMCPSSRCDFNDRYRVDNVIQSGLLGSLLLCLPNIKDGVIMPVCLSGILAALKNIRSILQGYVDCLQAALQDDKSVGICDTIRSIYICQILWKEAMTMLGLARGNLFDAAASRGGGEYLTGLKGGVENAKQTVNFFTNEYAKSVFAAYKGRSSKELGAVICEKAIYGKGPVLGDIMEDVTKAQNPPQFTAYIEEQPLYSETGQESAYKLYYHIYAGSQTVNYKVYVKKDSKTYVCKECSGTIEPNDFVDKSTIFTLEPGYGTICVDINGKHNCNFGRVVSSSFGVNRANDYWLQYELSKEITTEAQCRADTRGVLPNAQVEKVCSALNPGIGKGRDIEQEWKKVGTCGKNEQGIPLGDCWLRLGVLEDTNPLAYRETTGEICKKGGGNICGVGERCDGRKEITSVREYQDVTCCYGTCKKDLMYEEASDYLSEIHFVKSDALYKSMYQEGLDRCKDETIGTTDTFGKTSEEWQEFEAKMERAKTSSDEYNQFHYFKGMMYLLCKNCKDASYEFNRLDKDHFYYGEACEKNTIDTGGIIFDHCGITCGGKEGKKPGDVTPPPEEPKVLQIENLELTPSTGVTIDEIELKIDLETGGVYRIEKIRFNKPVENCYFKFGNQDTRTASCTKESCTFKETDTFSTVGIEEEAKLEITSSEEGVDYPTLFDFNVKISEKSAQAGKPLLCKTYDSKYYFCIGATGERCSDYYLSADKEKRASTVRSLEGKNIDGCKLEQECKNQSPVDCLPGSVGYANK